MYYSIGELLKVHFTVVLCSVSRMRVANAVRAAVMAITSNNEWIMVIMPGGMSVVPVGNGSLLPFPARFTFPTSSSSFIPCHLSSHQTPSFLSYSSPPVHTSKIHYQF